MSNRRRRLAVFVDGYWHGCPKCYNESKTNVEFWLEKTRRSFSYRRQPGLA